MWIEVTPTRSLVDEPMRIAVGGAPPGGRVIVRAALRDDAAQRWASWGAFVADGAGQADLAKQAPIDGTWDTADPLGLFWSMRDEGQPPGRVAFVKRAVTPLEVEITAEADGKTTASSIERQTVSPDVERMDLRAHGLVGTYFRPAGAGPFPSVIVVGGSGGGLNELSSALMASRGLAALALAYFGVEPLPLDLKRIPLEYFETAIGWLQARPEVRSGGVGFVGTSRGGELALVLGSTFPAINRVVAYVPSGVVHGAISRGETDPRNPEPAWTYRGNPVPFIRPSSTRPAPPPTPPGEPIPLTPIFTHMHQDPDAVAAATIPVERINGPVLLISGDEDQMWPSTPFSRAVVERLRSRGFPHRFEHRSYPDAGHMIGAPLGPTTIQASLHPVRGQLYGYGGTPSGNAAARADSWPRVIRFLKAD
ncbi:MAG TPA: acyl-CoA thioesterase/bile acid-CoA:amino acid N-acyltransferase family protein [Candidatus Methylomirabilis sp.]|nr:acyl-CoA thioesterase/bile acid-CoA:amino acid N-acyltransferase family protein [Candidatus Methylomirabilis sp.]